MKKLLVILGLGLLALNMQAQNRYFVTNNMAAGIRTIVPQAAVLQSLQVTGTSNTIVRLWDGPTTNVTAAYSNYTTFVTNRVSTFVSVQTGITNTVTNTVLYTLVQAVGAATNDVTPLLTLNIGANTTPFVFDNPLIFARRIDVSNNLGGITLVAEYILP